MCDMLRGKCRKNYLPAASFTSCSGAAKLKIEFPRLRKSQEPGLPFSNQHHDASGRIAGALPPAATELRGVNQMRSQGWRRIAWPVLTAFVAVALGLASRAVLE